MTASTLERHTLVTLSRTGWRELFMNRPELGQNALLAQWPEQNWPLVVRRPDPDMAPQHLALGIPLPPDCGKLRIAVAVDPGSVTSVAAPPTLTDIRASAPSVWHRTIDALLGLASAIRLVPRVFGSFAWHMLTGLPFVATTSDLDLLWPLSPDVEHLLTSLPAIEAHAPGALDGELVVEGIAVNWRELARGAHEVLTKTVAGVQLVSRDEFLGRAARA